MISQPDDKLKKLEQLIEKQYKESKNIENELVNIKSETLHLSEDIIDLDRNNNQFFMKTN